MKFSKKKSRPMKETQMISLADIAFLIIFFFMLSSNFMRDKTAVDLPKLPETAKTESYISVVVDAQGRLSLQGEPMENPKSLEANLRDLLEGKTRPEDCEVRLRCDRKARHKDVLPAYEAISNAGGIIAVMHEKSKETP